MALLLSMLVDMMYWVMEIGKESILYWKALAVGIESSLREEFSGAVLYLSFGLERGIAVPESCFVMWTNDNSFGNRKNIYYNQGSFFTSSALAIENSWKMLNASTSYIILFSVLIKSLPSFAFCRNPLYIHKDLMNRFFHFVPLNQQCFWWSVHPHSLLTQSHCQ